MSVGNRGTTSDGINNRHPGPRIALYSHDTCGLGHLRRNLVIARALRSRLSAQVLLISGIREAGSFPMGDGIDTLLLPALAKVDNLDYRPRRLGVSLDDLIRIRSSALHAAISSFRPDAFIVDNVPRGAVGELDETLQYLDAVGSTYRVLGMRDVLDTPSNVKREWSRSQNVSAVNDYYDAVWVYGDSTVFDCVSAYDFPDSVRRKTVFTGYVDPLWDYDFAPDRQVRPDEAPDMCVVGGGHDGLELAITFAKACETCDRNGMVLTGPFMDEADVQAVARMDRVLVRRFTANPISLYRSARKVVAMGGYNTILELLSLGMRPLIVPRVAPRQEQLIRAQALHDRGLVEVMHPAEMSPQKITDWLNADEEAVTHRVAPINMHGLDRIVDELTRVTSRSRLALAG